MGSTATGAGAVDLGVDGEVGEGMGCPTVPPSNSPMPEVVPSREESIPLRVTTINRVLWRSLLVLLLWERSGSLDLTRTQTC